MVRVEGALSRSSGRCGERPDTPSSGSGTPPSTAPPGRGPASRHLDPGAMAVKEFALEPGLQGLDMATDGARRHVQEAAALLKEPSRAAASNARSA